MIHYSYAVLVGIKRHLFRVRRRARAGTPCAFPRGMPTHEAEKTSASAAAQMAFGDELDVRAPVLDAANGVISHALTEHEISTY